MKGISAEDLGHLIGRWLFRIVFYGAIYGAIFYGILRPAFRYWTS